VSKYFGLSYQAAKEIVHPITSVEATVEIVELYRSAFANAREVFLWSDVHSTQEHSILRLQREVAHSHKTFESYEKIITALQTDYIDQIVDSARRAMDTALVSIGEKIEVEQPHQVHIQTKLLFGGSFAPSTEVISIWNEGIKELAMAESESDAWYAFASASPQQRAHEFSTMFRSTIGSYAQFVRYEGGSKLLVDDGRIAPTFQRALFEQFHLVPDRAAPFMSGLARDFLQALNDGWEIKADWGTVVLKEKGSAILDLNEIEFFEDPEFVESEDVD
jgi:hypothetical protein